MKTMKNKQELQSQITQPPVPCPLSQEQITQGIKYYYENKNNINSKIKNKFNQYPPLLNYVKENPGLWNKEQWSWFIKNFT